MRKTKLRLLMIPVLVPIFIVGWILFWVGEKHKFGSRLTFHCIGISCLVGAVFLQVLVFMDIASKGFFMGVEKNPVILNTEIAITIYCVVYLLYLTISRIRSLLNLMH